MSFTSIESARAERPQAERRSTRRLYKCWAAARAGKPLPRLRDFDFTVIEDLRSSIFLLGIEGPDQVPVIRYIGSNLSQEVGRDLTRLPLSDLPRPSLLAHIAYQYLRVIATRQPLAIEGSYQISASKSLFHRGILLPFSDSGERVDAVLGSFRSRASQLSAAPPKLSETTAHPSPRRAPAAPSPGQKAEIEVTKPSLADLRYTLRHSRDLAEEALQGESRSRRQLYRALAAAYAFFLQTKAEPEGYRSLLEEARLRPQDRAPFTPVIKLVFGPRLDKTQVSEYAAALGLAHRLGRPAEGFEAFLEERGLKHCVQEERRARRTERGHPISSALEEHEALRTAPALGEGILNAPLDGEFALLLARRSAADAACYVVIAIDASLDRNAATFRRIVRSQLGTTRAGRRSNRTPTRHVA